MPGSRTVIKIVKQKVPADPGVNDKVPSKAEDVPK